jgi:hypothetical protein
MIRVHFYDKENGFSREVSAIPREGETVVLHKEGKPTTFRYKVVAVVHVYENREWHREHARKGDYDLGDRIVVELTPE